MRSEPGQGDTIRLYVLHDNREGELNGPEAIIWVCHPDEDYGHTGCPIVVKIDSHFRRQICVSALRELANEIERAKDRPFRDHCTANQEVICDTRCDFFPEIPFPAEPVGPDGEPLVF